MAQKVRQHALLVQAPHLHGGLHCSTLAADAIAALVLEDIRHAQVHVWAESPIEAHFGFAVGRAALEDRQVDEA